MADALLVVARAELVAADRDRRRRGACTRPRAAGACTVGHGLAEALPERAEVRHELDVTSSRPHPRRRARASRSAPPRSPRRGSPRAARGGGRRDDGLRQRLAQLRDRRPAFARAVAAQADRGLRRRDRGHAASASAIARRPPRGSPRGGRTPARRRTAADERLPQLLGQERHRRRDQPHRLHQPYQSVRNAACLSASSPLFQNRAREPRMYQFERSSTNASTLGDVGRRRVGVERRAGRGATACVRGPRSSGRAASPPAGPSRGRRRSGTKPSISAYRTRKLVASSTASAGAA